MIAAGWASDVLQCSNEFYTNDFIKTISLTSIDFVSSFSGKLLTMMNGNVLLGDFGLALGNLEITEVSGGGWLFDFNVSLNQTNLSLDLIWFRARQWFKVMVLCSWG